MRFFIERKLKFGFPDYVVVRRPEKESVRRSECELKAVDFVLELPDKMLFVEVKNPKRGPRESEEEYKARLRDVESKDAEWKAFVKKFRDAFVYEAARSRLTFPVEYIVLINIDEVDILQSLQERLDWCLPVFDDSAKMISKVAVVNVDAWKKYMVEFPIDFI